MSDITIDSTTHNSQADGRHGPVWISPTVVYVFYRDSGGDFAYQKSTNGGQTWDGAVSVSTGSEVPAFSVWYDKWTPDDTGNIIHIAWGGSSFVRYRQLDTSDDSLGSVVNVRTAAAHSPGYLSIAKSQSGFLYVIDGGSNSATFDFAFMLSEDDGATWAAKANMTDLGTDVNDGLRLVPANTGDDDDIACLFIDNSAQRLEFKEYDYSGNSWSESGMATTGLVAAYMDVAVKHSDVHSHIVWMEDAGGGSYGLHTRDITKIGTVGSVVDIDTGLSNPGTCSIVIDQNNDDIYVIAAFDATNRTVYYYKSTDDGATWTSAIAFSDTADNLFYLNAGISISTSGGRFQPAWQNADLDDWITNYDNGIEILGAATATEFSSVNSGGGGNYQVLIDWDGDEDFTGSDEDVTADVQSLVVRQSRDLSTEYIKARTVDITLDNNDHKYSPTKGTISGIQPGRFTWVRYFYPYDTFTGDADTDLDAHTPDNDSSWEWVHPTSDGFELDGSGSVRTDGTYSNDGLAYMEFNDSDVTICVDIKTASSGGDPGLLFRFANSNNYLKVRITNGSTNNIELRSVIGGSETSEDTGDFTWSAGDTNFVVVQLHGTAIRVYINNGLIIDTTFTDGAVDSATKHGIMIHGSNSTDARWDFFGGFKSLFFGELDDVVIQARKGGNHRAVIKCIDNFERLKATQLRFANTLQTSGSVAGGTIAGELLTAANFYADARILDTGTTLIDDVDDGLKGIDDDALTALQKLQDEEDGFVYLDGMGFFRFEGRTHRTSAPHTSSKVTVQDTLDPAEQKMAFAQIDWSDGRDHIENVMLVKVQKLQLGTAKTVVWRHPETLTVEGGDDSTISIASAASRDFLAHISDNLSSTQTTGGFQAADAWVVPDVKVPASDGSQGANGVDPASVSESGSDWTNESNVIDSDDSRADYSGTGQSVLQITNFSTGSVPTDATILKLLIFVEGYGDSATDAERDVDVSFTKNGTAAVGDTVTVRLPQGSGSESITEVQGTTNDLWGTTWTQAEVTTTTFGVLLNKTTANNNGIHIDNVQVAVFYKDDIEANTTAPGGGTDITEDLVVTFVDTDKYAGKWRKIRVTNNNASTAHITKFQLRATPRQRIEDIGGTDFDKDPFQVEEEDSTSITDYGERRKEINALFVHRYSTARTLAQSRRDRRKDPKTELTLIFLPNERTTMSNLVQRQISDLVSVSYSDMGIDEDFFIESEEWTLSHVKQKVMVKWQLRED